MCSSSEALPDICYFLVSLPNPDYKMNNTKVYKSLQTYKLQPHVSQPSAEGGHVWMHVFFVIHFDHLILLSPKHNVTIGEKFHDSY